MEETQTHCYCGALDPTRREGTFQCSKCKKRFHAECLKNPVVTPLKADAFYTFTCGECASDGAEQCTRAKISWLDVVILALYNLQLGGGGKHGYFRWKDHICAFIDKHWTLLFGSHRRKKASWKGTVAGTLSANCPRHFVSGMSQLGESGWWKLAVMKPPLYDVEPPVRAARRPKQDPFQQLVMEVVEEDDDPSSKRTRRSKPFSLTAAIELKAKRSTISDPPGRKRRTLAALAESIAQAESVTLGKSVALAGMSEQDKDEDIEQILSSKVDQDTSPRPDLKTSSIKDEDASPEADLETSCVMDEDIKPDLFALSVVGQDTSSTTDENSKSGDGQRLETVYFVQTIKSKETIISTIPPSASVPEHLPQTKELDDSLQPSHPVKSDGLRCQSPLAGSSASEDDEAWGVRKTASCDQNPNTFANNPEGSGEENILMFEPVDSDDECLDMDSSIISSAAMGINFDPVHSPDMVDLIMSMPGTGTPESEAPSQSYLPAHLFTQPRGHGTQELECMSNDGDTHSESEYEFPSEERMGVKEKHSEHEDDSEEDDEEEERDASRTVSSDPTLTHRLVRRRRKRRREEEERIPEVEQRPPANKLRVMTPYDESIMLDALEGIKSVQPVSEDGQPLEQWEAERLIHEKNLLHRKLKVRKLAREHGLPVFDTVKTVERLQEKYYGIKPAFKDENDDAVTSSHPQSMIGRTLDRFLRRGGGAGVDVQHTSFHTRLVGFEDHQLQPIISPYTLRALKPFIWRDKETVPLKVKLMQEIISYPHRNDPTWTPPPPASIDYCYVRPQHIPSVNALCSAFFWPGIDLSESLQYPDFSCVAMYRKLVIGFAFLVPDVKHSEAYISFLFTRPEWRGTGIATFMLYHLCQTCMGKDITLHVSATNPAMLLYQKFGFKAEELCVDFYDKYFPVDSRECRHAFFMRMR